GNQQESAAADREIAYLDRRHVCYPATDAVVPATWRTAVLCAWLASMNPANNGCGFSGFDLNSGWNCTARYHGCDGSSAISTNLPSGDLPEMTRPRSVSVFSYRQLNS